MTQESTIHLEREDLMKILFALGYTQTGLKMEDAEPDTFISPEKFDQLADKLNQQWHDENHD